MLARAIERSGDPVGGAAMAGIGLDHVRRGGWRAVLPWPMLVLASCALATGDRDSASTRFSEALTFATRSVIPATRRSPCADSDSCAPR